MNFITFEYHKDSQKIPPAAAGHETSFTNKKVFVNKPDGQTAEYELRKTSLSFVNPSTIPELKHTPLKSFPASRSVTHDE